MRCFFDQTKSGGYQHSSGLVRVNRELFVGLLAVMPLGATLVPWRWDSIKKRPVTASDSTPLSTTDVFLSTELFSPDERPGFEDWLKHFPGTRIGVFYDGIPLQFPETTWPKSVARHPRYLHMLADFDHICAISAEACDWLYRFWEWAGIGVRAQLCVIPLGADFKGKERKPAVHSQWPDGEPELLQIGILEPRKNQLLTMEVCRNLWNEGFRFRVHFVGRENPHFGKPIIHKIRQIQKEGHPLFWHKQMSDESMEALFNRCGLILFPSQSEGFGLPVFESLWRGIPVLSADVPAVHVAKKGVEVMYPLDAGTYLSKLRSLLTCPETYGSLCHQLNEAVLPTWNETAQAVLKLIKIPRIR
jgi:glycosyltransferase involved in cell wall biosynthesis